MNTLSFSYDAEMDEMTIEGMRFSGGFFRAFSKDLNVGEPFEIIKREDGVITVHSLREIGG
jgi:hypothetical protein